MSALRKRFFMDYARGKPCLIRIAGVCGLACGGPETTVNAHFTLVGYKAMGSKKASLPDICGAHACNVCHGIVDGSIKTDLMDYDEKQLAHAEGVMRTLDLLVKDGILPNP